jgi:glycosyltransferase involved in cell wall biosynthesis
VAVEAQAAGKPVVAYGRGGACETVIDGVTGVLFDAQTLSCVTDAVTACAQLTTSPERIAANAARFSAEAFADGLTGVIAATRKLRALDISARLPMSI